ncbi:MAG: quinoprotein relay system zinc metallohydrolase 2 [Gammaproteobacteria bacterium]|nr:quinoprotein relay system zinc metallohydrolase 2 [Gammaproteobacteria bacterium]
MRADRGRAPHRGWLLCACAIFALSACAAGRPAGAATGFAVHEVAPGVYVHDGKLLPLDVPGHDDIANIGFVVGDRCVAVIDTGGSTRIGRELRAAILRRTRVPICYVINTHVHVDHVLGNAAFLPDHPHFVGHAALPAALARSRSFFLTQYAADLDQPPTAAQIVPPDRVVRDTLELDLGGRRLRLQAWPTAHTDCDLTVLDERTRTLWTGDLLFRERLPAVDGSAGGWIAVIDRIGRLNVRLVVPGHGPVTTRLAPALAAERRYLAALIAGVRADLRQGKSMQDAMRHVAASQRRYWRLWDSTNPGNVARVYQQLEWE